MHDPTLHTFKGFDELAHKRMELWLEKNYHLHRVRLIDLLEQINSTNQRIHNFFTWIIALEENLKLYLQYRYILHHQSLVNKFIDFFSENAEEENSLFFKKLFSIQTELGVLMAATKKQVELLLHDVPEAKQTLDEIHELLESISHPHAIDTSKSEDEIITAMKIFLEYSPPFDYLHNRIGPCKSKAKKEKSLHSILDFHHHQLIILAKDNGVIIVTDLDGTRYTVCESEINKIREVVNKFRQRHSDEIDKNSNAA